MNTESKKWDFINDSKTRKIIHILDTGVEGLCEPEFTELASHLAIIDDEYHRMKSLSDVWELVDIIIELGGEDKLPNCYRK